MKKQTVMKIASAAIAASMMFSASAPYVISYADTTASSSQSESAMKAALTKVKQRITIPEELSEFSYSNNSTYGKTVYYFTWQTPDSEKNYSSLTVNYVDGIITVYNYDAGKDVNSDTPSLAKLSDDELIAKAKEHLKMLDPDIYDKAEYEVSSIDLFGDYAYVAFTHKENGINVDGNGGTITLNKNTGELSSCYLSWFYLDTDYSSVSEKLSAAEAKEKFKEYCTLTPAYTISTDSETGERIATLVYRPSFTDEIDALTGEISTIWEDMNKDGGASYSPFGSYYYGNWAEAGAAEDTAEEEDAIAVSGDVAFTEAEMREIEADGSLLTKDELTAILQKDKYIALPKSTPLTNASLYKDGDDYFYSLQYDTYSSGVTTAYNAEDDVTEYAETADDFYLYAYVNAKTGAVINYSRSGGNVTDSTKAYPVTKMNSKAEEVIKYFYPDIYGEYKAADSNTEKSTVSYTDKDGTKHYSQVRTFIYNRYVNGVIVEGDYISVMIYSDGTVSNVNYNYTDIKFPSVPEFDSDKAFTQLFKQQKMDLYYDGYYKKDGTVKTYLVYKTNSFTLNSKYQLVNYYGKEITSTSSGSTDYTDISGIKQETAIKTLVRYGITLPTENGKFEPDKTLTDKEFAMLVYGATKGYVPYYIQNGNYNSDEKAVTLTKAEAAKVFVNASGANSVASLKGIFKSPYSDVSEDSEYVGYIAIAKAMGFMDSLAEKFYPNKKLTRAEAVQIVYDYIVNLSKT